MPATNAKRLRKGAIATTASAEAQRAKAEAIHACFVAPWIASRSLSSGARSRDPLARNDDSEGSRKSGWVLRRLCRATAPAARFARRVDLSRRPAIDGLVEAALLIPPSRLDKRGVAHVTDVGCGMRWTRRRRKTSDADPPSLKLRRTGTRTVERLLWRRARTAKSCGPDTPTLVSSFRRKKFQRERRWQESPVTGNRPAFPAPSVF